MEVHLVGIDCATEDAKVGLAFGCLMDANLRVDQALLCSKEETAAATIAGRLRGVANPTVLAIDAPLGWPIALGRALGTHRAGETIAAKAHDLFRRETDRFIKREIGKTPLDVGADRIARTAHAALRLLGDLRAYLTMPVPLAWEPTVSAPVSAIEVYPAATLVSHGLRSDGYKKREQIAERVEILRGLRTVAKLPNDLSSMESSADALDAAVCLLAASDFLAGQAMPPKDRALAETEGWIWARARPSGIRVGQSPKAGDRSNQNGL